jgi:hypothetical protein
MCFGLDTRFNWRDRESRSLEDLGIDIVNTESVKLQQVEA